MSNPAGQGMPPASGRADVDYPVYPRSQLAILMEMLVTNHEFLSALQYALGGLWQGVVTDTQVSPPAVKVRHLAAGSTSPKTGWIRIAAVGYSPTVGDKVLLESMPGGTKHFVIGKIT